MARGTRGVKRKEHENLTAVNIQKVISLLQPTSPEEKPITKKEACNILNIAYNTTRLDKIIDDFLERKAYTDKRKAQNRGRGATKDEIKSIIEDYIEGDNISSIAKRLYRSPSFVKAIVERTGIPQRNSDHSVYFLPDECVSDTFKPTQKVWSACYNGPATVVKEQTSSWTDYEEKYGSKAYQIYVHQALDNTEDSWFPGVARGGFYAVSAAYDLGSLEHLEQYGVSI